MDINGASDLVKITKIHCSRLFSKNIVVLMRYNFINKWVPNAPNGNLCMLNETPREDSFHSLLVRLTLLSLFLFLLALEHLFQFK